MELPKLLIDTSIIIDHLRKKDKSKTILFNLYCHYSLYISAVTIFELYNGASSPDKSSDIALLVKNIQIFDFTSAIAIESSRVYRELLSENRMIEFRDIFIASTAIVNAIPLATGNQKHFQRIKNLTLI